MQSLVPACSNISKLIFNNDQALLLLVQNYDYLQTDLNSKYICVVDEELQLHQYVPMPHPNNMAAIDLLTSPETQNCANFTRHVLAFTWGIWLLRTVTRGTQMLGYTALQYQTYLQLLACLTFHTCILYRLHSLFSYSVHANLPPA